MLKMSAPSNSIVFTVTENAAVTGSFVAHVGASHTVKILNPYPTGTAVLDFKGPKSFQASGTANIQLGVRNIGRTDIEETRIHTLLTDGNKIQEVYSDRITVPALEEKEITIPFPIKVSEGMYELEINNSKALESVKIPIQVGNPKVTIEKIEKHSSENQMIQLTIANKWNKPLPDATLGLTVESPEDKTTLFEASSLATLMPGENIVSLRIMKPKYLKNGLYPADLQVLSPPFYTGASGEFQVELTEVGKMIQQQGTPIEQAWEYKAVPVDMPRVQKVAKAKQLLAVVLIVAIAIFLFSLAMLFRKRQEPNEKQTQTPQTQPKA